MRGFLAGFLLRALLILASPISFASDAPPGVHAGAWAGAAASAKASAGASVKTSQTTAQQAALVSTQTVTVAAPAAASSGGGSAGGKTTTVRMVPDPYAPTMNATSPCRISVSGGVTVIGVGVSGGGSVEDDPCNLRETARLLSGIGYPDAAARIMCNDPRSAKALGEAICPAQQPTAMTGAGSPDCLQDETIAKRLGAPVCQ